MGAPWEKYQQNNTKEQLAPWVKYQQQPKRPPISMPESAIVGAADAASWGVGDEIIAGLTAAGSSALAPIVSGVRGILGYDNIEMPNFSETYNKKLSEIRQGQKQAFEDNPASYIAGGLTGAIASGGGITNAIPAIGKANAALQSVTLPTKVGSGVAIVAKNAIPAGVAGAAYGFNAGEGGFDKRIENAKNIAALSAGLGVALPFAVGTAKYAGSGAANIARGVKARSPEVLQEIASEAKRGAGNIRNQMTDMGVQIKPQAAQKISSMLEAKLGSLDIIPQLTPETSNVIATIKNAASTGELSLNHLDQYRRLLKNARSGEDLYAATQIRNALDDVVNELNPSFFTGDGKQAVNLLNQFRKEYTQASKFEDVADILAKSAGDPNKIKNNLYRFMQNPKNTRGWNDAEKGALKAAATSSTVESLMKGLGKFGFDVGTSITAGNTALPVASLAFGSPIVTGLGTAARYGQKLQARGRAEKLLQTIEGQPIKTIKGKAKATNNSSATNNNMGSGANINNGILTVVDDTSNLPTAMQPNTSPPTPNSPINVSQFSKYLPPAQVAQQSTQTVATPKDEVITLPDQSNPIVSQTKPIRQSKVDVAQQSKDTNQSYNTQMELPNTSFTQQNEGLRTSTYTDTEGNPTVGYGFNFNSGIAPKAWKQSGLARYKNMAKVKRGEESITPQEAQALYQTSISIAAKDAMAYYPDFERLSQSQQEALLDMSYQMGGNSLNEFKGLKNALKKQDKNAIVKSIINSKYYQQTPERAKSIATMLTTLQGERQ